MVSKLGLDKKSTQLYKSTAKNTTDLGSRDRMPYLSSSEQRLFMSGLLMFYVIWGSFSK
jgi:hypothetical protein